MPIFTEAVKERRYREITNLDNCVIPSAVVPYITQGGQEQLLEVHKTVLPIVNLPLTLLDAQNGNGIKVATLPEGRILFLGAHIKDFNCTTTSVLASTLNAGVNLSVGLGSTTQANGTLATTEQNIVNAFTAVASATINVAGANAQGNGPSAPLSLDGTATPVPLYLNVGVPTATDIDADATVLLNCTIEWVWCWIGDH